MVPVSRSRVRRSLRRLSTGEFRAFVAALWEARGWETTRDGDVVVADRDGERRILLVRHAAGWRSVATPWGTDRDDVTDVVTSGPADRVRARELAAALDARLHGRDDLYDLARYGLDRDTADDLLREHLGHPAVVPERSRSPAAGIVPDAITRVGARRGMFAVVIVIAVVVATILAGGGSVPLGGGSGEPTPGTPAPVDTLAPTPTPTATPVPTPTFGAVIADPAADAWPMFRGDPANTGRNDRVDDPSAPVRVLATVELEDGVVASPAVVNGTVYVGTMDGHLYALDATNATVRWRRLLGDQVASSPAVLGGAIYVGATERQPAPPGYEFLFSVSGIRADDGALAWRQATRAIAIRTFSIAPTSSPTPANGTLYVGGIDRYVYAFGAATGETRWAFRTDATVLSSPAVANDTVYVATMNGTVYALGARGGTERWNVSLDGGAIASPAVANGTVYIGTVAGTVYAIDAITGTVRWTAATTGSVTASAAIGEAVVLVGSEDAHVYGIDPSNGRIRWTFAADDGIVASPALVDGTAYVGTRGGRIYAIDAATGNATWSFAAGDAILASPAVADGRVYAVTATGTVYVLGGGDACADGRQDLPGPFDLAGCVNPPT